jgi:hypothetical protein
MRSIDDLSPDEFSTLALAMGQQAQETAARLQVSHVEFILVVVRTDESRTAATCRKYMASTILRQIAQDLDVTAAKNLQEIKGGVA